MIERCEDGLLSNEFLARLSQAAEEVRRSQDTPGHLGAPYFQLANLTDQIRTAQKQIGRGKEFGPKNVDPSGLDEKWIKEQPHETQAAP